MYSVVPVNYDGVMMVVVAAAATNSTREIENLALHGF
jgi:hypothetical protein